MPLFTPKYLFKNVTNISLAFLKENNIKGLVLDVDNTLTAHGSQKLADDIQQWLDDMRAADIPMMIASNNTKERVTPFAKMLGMDFVSFSCKPFPLWFMAAQKKWKLPRENIAIVGDQLFTDGLAGHLIGVKALLVRPMYEDTAPTVRFKRKLEKPFLLKYYKKGGKLL